MPAAEGRGERRKPENLALHLVWLDLGEKNVCLGGWGSMQVKVDVPEDSSWLCWEGCSAACPNDVPVGFDLGRNPL